MEFPEEAVDVSENKDGGIKKLIITKGADGGICPCSGDKVTVHYTGTLYGSDRHGEKFDSSRDRNSPFEFTLGKGQVIKGWDQAVATMTKGEIADVYIQSQYGYGESGSGASIPPNTALKFNIELLSWKGEDVSDAKDESVMKSTIRRGTSLHKKPSLGSHVTVSVVGRLADGDAQEIDHREKLEFDLGEGDTVSLCAGVEAAITKMNEGELARVTIEPSSGYGSCGNPELGVPPDATLIYDLELIKYEPFKESWELDATEKVEKAEVLKLKGTNYVKKQMWSRANSFYERAETYVSEDYGFDGDIGDKRNLVRLALHLNTALCYLKLKDYLKARENCDKALELDNKSDKALFRRGEAHFGLEELEEAREDFRRVLEITPSNKAARTQLTAVIKKMKDQKEKDKRTYYGMFEKFAARNAKENANGDQDTEKSDKKSTEKESVEAETENEAVKMET